MQMFERLGAKEFCLRGRLQVICMTGCACVKPGTCLVQIFERLGAKEFLPQRKAASDLYGQMCKRAPTFCLQALESICGYNDANMNLTRLPLYFSYTPAGVQQ